MNCLSIILPIYNVEPYLERCIRSLEDQDISIVDFEIICINDGSPDKSRDVVLTLQKEFENLILIDQENQGVSRARNNGIKRARGEYILFIDPDDYVEPRSFKHMLRNAGATEAEVLFCGFTLLNHDGTILKRVINEAAAKTVYPGTEAYKVSRFDRSADPDRSWAVLFRTEFLIKYNLLYLPNVPYLEDGEFIARVLCLAERCIFDNNSFYQRTKRKGSATNSNLFFSERAKKGFLLSALNLKRFQQTENLTSAQKNFLNQPICKFVVLEITSLLKPFVFKRICETELVLNRAGLGKLKLDSVSMEFRLLGFIYNKSVCLLIMHLLLVNSIRSIKLRFDRNVIKIFKNKIY